MARGSLSAQCPPLQVQDDLYQAINQLYIYLASLNADVGALEKRMANVNGSFTTVDGKTVTVTAGIVTNIV